MSDTNQNIAAHCAQCIMIVMWLSLTIRKSSNVCVFECKPMHIDSGCKSKNRSTKSETEKKKTVKTLYKIQWIQFDAIAGHSVQNGWESGTMKCKNHMEWIQFSDITEFNAYRTCRCEIGASDLCEFIGRLWCFFLSYLFRRFYTERIYNSRALFFSSFSRYVSSFFPRRSSSIACTL